MNEVSGGFLPQGTREQNSYIYHKEKDITQVGYSTVQSMEILAPYAQYVPQRIQNDSKKN